MLEVGSLAPEFTLKDQNGQDVSLSQFKGKKVVLYFYPKDNTSGCTKQACTYAELYPQFVEKGAVVLGVSKDSVGSHQRFAEKYNFPFTILSDPDHEVIEKYDVWKEKSMYGKKYMGVVRSTYLIDENGIIEKAFEKVKPAEDPLKMLNVVDL
ncbi:peroxiredoxin Q/BCP [Firmicutes bacterium M10-2]|nr:peroxiredoxin Q/BCP [Firmicutes bacterium M10-2]